MATKMSQVNVSSDPWQVMDEIKIPRARKGEDDYIIASVNGRTFKVQKGKVVKVPRPIAEVLEHSFEQLDAADDFIRKTSGTIVD